MTKDNCATWSEVPAEVRLLCSQRVGDRGAIFLGDYISKRLQVPFQSEMPGL